MILKQIKYKGSTILPYQIKNKKCYFFKNGKTINFPYILSELPDYYVAGGGLYMDSSTTEISEDKVILTSVRIFEIQDDSLIIKN